MNTTHEANSAEKKQEKEPLLVENIQLLSHLERKELRLFVQSPYFTRPVKNHKSEDLLKLLDFVLLNQEHSQAFEKNLAWESVFPGTALTESTLNSLMSNLLKLVHQFIHLQAGNFSNPSEEYLSIARFYRLRQPGSRFEQYHREATLLLETQKTRDQGYFFQKFQLEYEQLLWRGLNNERSSDINTKIALEYLDWAYVLQKFEIAFGMLTQQRMVSFDSLEILPVEMIATRLDSLPVESLPSLVQGLHLGLKIATASNVSEEILQAFRLFLEQNDAALSDSLRTNLNALLRNYFTALYNRSGKREYLEELFELYRSQLKNGLLLKDNCISVSILQNLTNVATKLGKLDWLQQFLESRPYPISSVENAAVFYDYNLAQCHFAAGNFALAEKLLNQSFTETYHKMYGDTYYILHAHRLEIKIGYETFDIPDPLLDKLKAFRIKIIRWSEKTLPDDRREMNLNFIRHVQALALLKRDLKFRKDTCNAKIFRLREKMETTQTSEREWLLEKTEQLIIPAVG